MVARPAEWARLASLSAAMPMSSAILALSTGTGLPAEATAGPLPGNRLTLARLLATSFVLARRRTERPAGVGLFFHWVIVA